MRKILLPFILLLSFALHAQVTINLKNTTGQKLEKVTVNGISIGTMQIDEAKDVVLESVIIRDDSPDLDVSIVYDGQELSTGKRLYCGTPPPVTKKITEGSYNRDIMMFTNPSWGTYLAISIGPPDRWKQ